MLMQRHFISLHIGINPEVVALLLEYNADPDKPRSDGATPLDAASQQNHTEVILLLKAHRP